MGLTTLADYLEAREISLVELARRAVVTPTTIKGWCNPPRAFDHQPEKRVVRQVARTLDIEEELLAEMISNGRKSLSEPVELRAIRKAIALLEFASERGVSANITAVRRAVQRRFFPDTGKLLLTNNKE